jgi:hypothetical protein
MIKEKYTIKDFLPLISIFVGITVVSLLLVNVFDGGVMRWMEVFMGLFFVVFGLFKVFNLKGFADAYRMYDVIAMKYPQYGYLYPFVELALGGLYLASLFPVTVNVVTLFVMGISAVGVYLKLRKKEKILCACLGVVFKVPMTWVTLGEDALMAAMALTMLAIIF